eukprot:g61472.t1
MRPAATAALANKLLAVLPALAGDVHLDSSSSSVCEQPTAQEESQAHPTTSPKIGKASTATTGALAIFPDSSLSSLPPSACPPLSSSSSSSCSTLSVTNSAAQPPFLAVGTTTAQTSSTPAAAARARLEAFSVALEACSPASSQSSTASDPRGVKRRRTSADSYSNSTDYSEIVDLDVQGSSEAATSHHDKNGQNPAAPVSGGAVCKDATIGPATSSSQTDSIASVLVAPAHTASPSPALHAAPNSPARQEQPEQEPEEERWQPMAGLGFPQHTHIITDL